MLFYISIKGKFIHENNYIYESIYFLFISRVIKLTMKDLIFQGNNFSDASPENWFLFLSTTKKFLRLSEIIIKSR